jgi:DNA-binding MarR family transcriptional regulator
MIDTDVCEEGLKVDRYFRSYAGLDALKPEAKILFTLGSRGPLAVKQLMLYSGLSYRGFYIVVNRLTALGLIETYQDKDDGRVRRIKLVPRPPGGRSSHDGQGGGPAK